jgi:hypothetical protein
MWLSKSIRSTEKIGSVAGFFIDLIPEEDDFKRIIQNLFKKIN